MPSASYIHKKQKELSERNKERGKRGNDSMRRQRVAKSSEMIVTGTMTTTGVFGSHFIELLADPDDSVKCWMRVDGAIRQPRTCRGVKGVVGDWIFSKANMEK